MAKQKPKNENIELRNYSLRKKQAFNNQYAEWQFNVIIVTILLVITGLVITFLNNLML